MMNVSFDEAQALIELQTRLNAVCGEFIHRENTREVQRELQEQLNRVVTQYWEEGYGQYQVAASVTGDEFDTLVVWRRPEYGNKFDAYPTLIQALYD